MNTKSEINVIGAMINDNSCAYIPIELLNADCFTEDRQKIFRIIRKLYMDNKPIDLVSIFESDSKINASKLVEYQNAVQSSANIEYHSKVVKEHYMRRRLKELGYELSKDSQEDIFELIDAASSKIMQIGQDTYKKQYTDIVKPTNEALAILESILTGKSEFGIKTGFYDIDNLLGGFQKQDLIIIAARPSMGKTSLMLNIATNQAKTVPIGVFSLEMSAVKLSFRQLAIEAGISVHRLMAGRLNSDEIAEVNRASERVKKLSLYIDDTGGLSTIEFKTKARRMKMERDVKAIYVDYLQLMVHRESGINREREISMISQTLKETAKELDIPIIALSQLSRSVEHTADKKPTLAHLRDSGGIEQDADIVSFIYRPEYYAIPSYNGTNSENLAILMVEKNRNGATEELQLLFDKSKTLFKDYSNYSSDLI